MAERTGEYELFQQTFLGSSITNFSISVGWNSNPSTLSVNLINEKLDYLVETMSMFELVEDEIHEDFDPYSHQEEEYEEVEEDDDEDEE